MVATGAADAASQRAAAADRRKRLHEQLLSIIERNVAQLPEPCSNRAASEAQLMTVLAAEKVVQADIVFTTTAEQSYTLSKHRPNMRLSHEELSSIGTAGNRSVHAPSSQEEERFAQSSMHSTARPVSGLQHHRPRHPPAKLGNISFGSPALSAASTPLTTPHKRSRLGQAEQQTQPGLQLLPQAYYGASPMTSSPSTMLQHPVASPAPVSKHKPVQEAQSVHSFSSTDNQQAQAAKATSHAGDTAVQAEQQTSARLSLFGIPVQHAPAGKLAEQLQQKGLFGAKEPLPSIVRPSRPSSPNSFQPHALKPITNAVASTPSRFGRGRTLKRKAAEGVEAAGDGPQTSRQRVETAIMSISQEAAAAEAEAAKTRAAAASPAPPPTAILGFVPSDTPSSVTPATGKYSWPAGYFTKRKQPQAAALRITASNSLQSQDSMQSQKSEQQEAEAASHLQGRQLAPDAVPGVMGSGITSPTDKAQTHSDGNADTGTDKDHGAIWREAATEGELPQVSSPPFTPVPKTVIRSPSGAPVSLFGPLPSPQTVPAKPSEPVDVAQPTQGAEASKSQPPVTAAAAASPASTPLPKTVFRGPSSALSGPWFGTVPSPQTVPAKAAKPAEGTEAADGAESKEDQSAAPPSRQGFDAAKRNKADTASAEAASQSSASGQEAPVASGWGTSFLESNQAAAKQAQDAVLEESKEAEKGAQPQQAIKFGVLPASATSTVQPMASEAAAAKPAAAAPSGWGDAFLQGNKQAAAASADATAKLAEEQGQSHHAGATPTFSFGVASIPAAPSQEPDVAAQSSMPHATNPASTAASAAPVPAAGGSAILQSNLQSAAESANAAVKAVEDANSKGKAKYTFGVMPAGSANLPASTPVPSPSPHEATFAEGAQGREASWMSMSPKPDLATPGLPVTPPLTQPDSTAKAPMLAFSSFAASPAPAGFGAAASLGQANSTSIAPSFSFGMPASTPPAAAPTPVQQSGMQTAAQPSTNSTFGKDPNPQPAAQAGPILGFGQQLQATPLLSAAQPAAVAVPDSSSAFAQLSGNSTAQPSSAGFTLGQQPGASITAPFQAPVSSLAGPAGGSFGQQTGSASASSPAPGFAFGQQNGGAFGQQTGSASQLTSNAPSSLFGVDAGQQIMYGQQPPSMSSASTAPGFAFGQQNGSAFGEQSGDAFSISSSPSGLVFGQQSSNSFGQQPASAIPSSTSSFSFGQPTGSAFGLQNGNVLGQQSSNAFGQQAGNAFGQPTGNAFAQQSSSAFPAPSSTPTLNFGQPPSSLVGQTQASGAASAFGVASMPAAFGGTAGQQQPFAFGAAPPAAPTLPGMFGQQGEKGLANAFSMGATSVKHTGSSRASSGSGRRMLQVKKRQR